MGIINLFNAIYIVKEAYGLRNNSNQTKKQDKIRKLILVKLFNNKKISSFNGSHMWPTIVSHVVWCCCCISFGHAPLIQGLKVKKPGKGQLRNLVMQRRKALECNMDMALNRVVLKQNLQRQFINNWH